MSRDPSVDSLKLNIVRSGGLYLLDLGGVALTVTPETGEVHGPAPTGSFHAHLHVSEPWEDVSLDATDLPPMVRTQAEMMKTSPPVLSDIWSG